MFETDTRGAGIIPVSKDGFDAIEVEKICSDPLKILLLYATHTYDHNYPSWVKAKSYSQHIYSRFLFYEMIKCEHGYNF